MLGWVCVQTDTNGVAGKLTEPEPVCVQNRAHREHFAMGTVVMKTKTNLPLMGRSWSLTGSVVAALFLSPFAELSTKTARLKGSVHPNHASDGLRRGSTGCPFLYMRTCSSTNTDKLKSFSVSLTTFLREVARVFTLKGGLSILVHMPVDGPTSCIKPKLTSGGYGTIMDCLCLTAAVFSPFPLWSTECCSHSQAQPSVSLQYDA